MDLDYRLLLDGFADAVVAADLTGRIAYVNPATSRLLGWPGDELVGQPLLTLVPPRLHEAHRKGFSRFVATREPRLIGRPTRVPALRKDGSEVEVELTLAVFPAEHDSGVAGGALVVGSIRDL